jgi:hypothetical protein
MDIDGRQGGRYRLLSRQFHIDDLKILAECVRSAKFISDSKSNEIIASLESLCSIYEADTLNAEVFLVNRVKTTQKGTLNIISTINAAMAKKLDGKPHTPQKISFKYLKYTINDVEYPTERRQGKLYKVSPYRLLLNDGNYYLLAFSDRYQDMRTYRLDRMKDVRQTGEPREGMDAFKAMDMETITQRVFGMMSGRRERVTLRFITPLLDTAVDRFGRKGVVYQKVDEDHFTVTADVDVSDQFFAWVTGFGRRVKIVAPESVVEKYKKHLDKVREMY